jgi:putative molybdopterin biosynthesis protein
MDENTPLTPQEIADLLKIAKNTVYELIKRGELNGYRVGNKVRVDLKDVEAYKNKTRSVSTSKESTAAESTVSNPAAEFDNLFHNEEQPSGFVICGQDIILDILARHLELRFRGLRTLRSYLGSYNGLYALYRGDVQVATAHLWDAKSDSYNVSYVRNMLPGTPAVIYHLVCRQEGFYVANGNPKGIKGWEDLRRRDITIVNRERGSGARILLDEHLQSMGIQGKRIAGYGRECSSHLTVASTVARGGADLGLGIEKAGLQVKNIEFIPLQQEQYDLVLKKEDESKPVFKDIVEIIRSEEFMLELSGLGGYDLTGIGKIIAET